MLVKIVNCLLSLCMISSATCSFSTNSYNAAADASLAFSYATASYSFRILSWVSVVVLNSKASLIRGSKSFAQGKAEQ